MDIINLINSSRVGQNLVNGAAKEMASRISEQVQIQKIESILKLIYNLFLYSILGFFVKIVTRLFKI